MATTPSGFWYPSPGDTINSISGLFAQQAASAETALNDRILQDGIAKFNDAAERSAAYTIAPPSEGTMTYLRSTGEYEQWNGTAWVPPYERFPADVSNLSVAYGVNLSPVNLTTTKTQFWSGAFTAPRTGALEVVVNNSMYSTGNTAGDVFLKVTIGSNSVEVPSGFHTNSTALSWMSSPTVKMAVKQGELVTWSASQSQHPATQVVNKHRNMYAWIT